MVENVNAARKNFSQYWEAVTASRREEAARIGRSAAEHRKRLGHSSEAVAARANQLAGRLRTPREITAEDVADFEAGEIWDDPFNPMDRPVWAVGLIAAALETTLALLATGTEWSPDAGRLRRASQLHRELTITQEIQRRESGELLRLLKELGATD